MLRVRGVALDFLQRDGGLDRVGAADDPARRVSIDDAFESLADERVIVDDEDADRRVVGIRVVGNGDGCAVRTNGCRGSGHSGSLSSGIRMPEREVPIVGPP